MKNKIDTNKDKLLRMVISLVLAFFLWAFALSNTDQTQTKQFKGVPVTFINEANLTALDLVLDNDKFTVDVTLYGNTVQVSKMQKSDLVAIVDVSSVKSVGLHSLEVSISGAAQNVSVSEISNKYISVSVSDMKFAEKVVEISKTGTLAEGYAVIGEDSDFKVAEVYGNAENVGKVASVKANINVNSVSQDVRMKAQLVAYDENDQPVSNVTVAPENVDISITVGKIKEVPLELITAGNVPEGFVFYGVTSDIDTVKIAAKENILNGITSVKTAAMDISSRTASYTTSVSLEAVEDVVFLSETPIRVNVQIEPEETRELSFSTVSFINVTEGLSASAVHFNGLTATFSGDGRIISELDTNDVKVYADLKDLEEGSHTVTVEFDLPEGVRLKNTEPMQLTVTVSK